MDSYDHTREYRRPRDSENKHFKELKSIYGASLWMVKLNKDKNIVGICWNACWAAKDKQIDILINMPKLKELYGLNLSVASKEKINLLRKSQIEKIGVVGINKKVLQGQRFKQQLFPETKNP